MSTTPSWDARNQGFVPPTQLRKTRPLISVTRMDSSSGQPEQRPQQHTRTSSFFSFSSKKSAQQQAQQATQAVQQRSPPTSPSLSGHMPPASVASTHFRRPSIGGDAPSPMSPNPAVQREIKSVVDLSLAHAHKIYFSGPLVRRVERLPDGNKPGRDAGWVDVWAQLGGTTLSVWDMKAIEEASKRGEEVPPSYINVTDSFIQVLGALTSPATPTAPPKRYTNVITLNTAGSNLMLFACPSSQALISWAAALRLAGWEKTRLEEIYTGHLLKMSLSEGDSWKEPATTLIRGRLEGQVKIRVAGQTDWKPLWMVLSSSNDPMNAGSKSRRPISPSSTRSKNRMSGLFSRAQSPPPAGQPVPVISLYASQKPKDRKKPLLTMRHVSQAFAVYPERPEVIQRSTLIKIEGLLGDEDLAGAMKGKECWMMLMPETQQAYPVFELLKWLVAFHDTYALYGRPTGYVWDPRQPSSMWFAYPVGVQRAQLFFDREMAESLDPRDDRTSAIRKELKQILINRLYGGSPPPGTPQIGQPITQHRAGPGSLDENHQSKQRQSGAPMLPPIQAIGSDTTLSAPTPQLPPLKFGGVQQQPGVVVDAGSGSTPSFSRGVSSLPPTTERITLDTQVSGSMLQPQRALGEPPGVSTSSPPFSTLVRPTPERQSSQPSGNVLEGSMINNQIDESPNVRPTQRGSEDSYTGSRPDSKLAKSASYVSPSFGHADSRALSNSKPSSPTQSLTDVKPPSTAPSSYPPTPLTHRSFAFTSPVPTSPLPQSQGSGLSPRSERHSPAAGSSHSQNAREESNSSTPGQQHAGPSPPPPIQTIASSAVPGSHSPPSQPPASQAWRPPPKIDTEATTPSTSMTTPAIIKREWPQPPADVPSLQPKSMLPSDHGHDLATEAGALYLLQEQAQAGPSQPRETWSTEEEDECNDSDSGPERNPPPRRGGTPPVSRMPPAAFRQLEAGSEFQIGSHGTGRSIGRKPSGARAKPTPRRYPDATSSLEPGSGAVVESPPMTEHLVQGNSSYDNSDALAALTFLENQEEPPPKLPVHPSAIEKKDPSPPPNESHLYPSTFAPSKQAAERKAKAQAQQEASYAATHLPGKPNGNSKNKKKDRSAWAESSDEDEEEDEEEEGSDEDAPAPLRQPQPLPASDPRVSVYPSAQPGPHGALSLASEGYGHKQTRRLPMPPGRPGGSPQDYQNSHARVVSSQNDDRPRTHIGDEPRGHTINPHQAARQSVWSTVLDPQLPPRNTSGKDTFVQVDQSESMTKAFQPQGLLSAGLQDKEDRSAKRQEELARETGASLINVPNKPPPPQTGLLGAITAHERERKREGGVGATLTEKERDRRLAEERQRKLDDLQRQQLDQMSQGNGGGAYDLYGQQQFPGIGQQFDPRMSMNPMMLNPYMAGGFPMMPFANPQQMMAAQLAAQQAYQHAMMSFSQSGGSQMGDNTSRVGATPMGTPGTNASPMQGGMGASASPMQTGMMVSPASAMPGGMMDPRLSMMSPMALMGMNPMVMNPMMMGQTFDPRMSMGQPNFPQRPESRQGHLTAYQGTPSPRQGSPALPRSGNNSPRPHG